MLKRVLACLWLCRCLSGIAAAETQPAVASWGLDRVDQRTGTDGAYMYDYAGGNTIVYVVDQGVAEVNDLAGRILEHRAMRFTGPDNLYSLTSPINEHGTKAASVAAGATYGVAKGAAIVDVRAWSYGTNSAGVPVSSSTCLRYNPQTGADETVNCLIAAFNDIAGRHPASMKGVVNLSGTAGQVAATEREAFRAAIHYLNARGILVVVAATEYGAGACTTTPAEFGASSSGLSVITVSAVESDDRLAVDEARQNATAGSGPCVDLFAPSKTLAASHINGASLFEHTSSATPFVSGAAALVFSQNPWMQPHDVEDLLKENATLGVLGNIPAGTVNALLYTRLPDVTVSTSWATPGQTASGSVTPFAGATYAWSISNGTILGSSTGSGVSFTTGCPHQATLKVTIRTGDGRAFSGYGWVQITPATASVRGSASINAGQSATLSLSLTGTGPWQVTWSDGLQQTYTSSAATRTVTPSVTTTYRASVRDASGCAGTSSGYATITVCPVSTSISAPAQGNASMAITVSVPETAGATYQWSVTNGMIWTGATSTSPTIILGCSGTTTVTVTMTTTCGQQSTGSKSIPIQLPAAAVWNSSTVAAGDTAIVAVSFSGTAPFSVTFSDGVRITSINSYTYYYYVTPPVTTTYTATAMSSKYGCAGTTTGSATVTVE